MEAVGAGAGVIAFAGVALDSIKVIVEIISSVKSQPQQVQSFSAAIQNLDLLLQKVSQSSAVRSASHETDLEGLWIIVRLCKEDVKRYERTIRRVTIVRNDSKAGRAWKHVKTILKEKDFQQMREELLQHASIINTHLCLLQMTYAQDTSTQIREQNSRLVNISGRMQAWKHESAQWHDDLGQSLASLDNRFEQMTMSGGQLEQISTVMWGLLAQIKHFSQAAPQYQPPTSNDLEVLESINRLCQLAEQKQGTLHSEEAERVIEDLSAILANILNSVIPEKLQTLSPLERQHCVEKEDGEFDGCELRRVSGLLGSARSVKINEGLRQIARRPPGTNVQKRQLKKLTTAYGNCVLTTRRRRFLQEDAENCIQDEEFTAILTVMLNHPRLKSSNFTASFHQRAINDGFFSLSPKICVGFIQPHNAPIIRYVMCGNMEKFLNSLQNGEATVWDRDPGGIPLFNFAYRQPAMIKFFIEAGVDIDERVLEESRILYIEFDELANGESHHDRGYDMLPTFRSTERIESVKLLLEAGADCTLDFPSSLGDRPRGIYMADPETIKIALNLDPGFIDFKTDSPSQKFLPSMIVEHLHSPEATGHGLECGLGSLIKTLEALFRKGVNFNDLRGYNGRTLMHELLFKNNLPCRQNCLKELLKFLLSKGADFNLCDEQGYTVTRAAYDENYDWDVFNFTQHHSFKGDVWDTILVESGHDIAEFRKAYSAPRKPPYAKSFLCSVDSRLDFEELWRGMEDRCPYWDDPPSWPPDCPEDPGMFYKGRTLGRSLKSRFPEVDPDNPRQSKDEPQILD